MYSLNWQISVFKLSTWPSKNQEWSSYKVNSSNQTTWPKKIKSDHLDKKEIKSDHTFVKGTKIIIFKI